MNILFCKAPIEEDINSILSLLTLNEEHMRVKKYICEYFHIPTELALQNNAALETTVRPSFKTSKIIMPQQSPAKSKK